MILCLLTAPLLKQIGKVVDDQLSEEGITTLVFFLVLLLDE